jgi:hypothetical protein
MRAEPACGVISRGSLSEGMKPVIAFLKSTTLVPASRSQPNCYPLKTRGQIYFSLRGSFIPSAK